MPKGEGLSAGEIACEAVGDITRELRELKKQLAWLEAQLVNKGILAG